ncbi:hypothetical protein ACSS7Z_15005 [Microbacterium sp. A82]|uniref:hypothetical protein n=1 Tax=Microbacterium sp. A82 TaxID=3450452 RepID=UPI003F3F20DA
MLAPSENRLLGGFAASYTTKGGGFATSFRGIDDRGRCDSENAENLKSEGKVIFFTTQFEIAQALLSMKQHTTVVATMCVVCLR